MGFRHGRFDTQGNPGLWRTHDGGQHWKKVLDNPVPYLEAGSGKAWAIVLDLGGTFPQVFQGSVHADALHLVTQAGNRSATLTVAHGSVYVVAQQGAGPIATTLLVIEPDGTRRRYPNPCRDKYSWDLQVVASPTGRIVAICSGEPSAGSQLKSSYTSTDGGRSWTREPDPPGGGYTGRFDGSTAATHTAVLFSGGRSPIYRRRGAGAWRAVLLDEDGSGFPFVGMTDDLHGVALGQQGAWLTADGASTWRQLQFR